MLEYSVLAMCVASPRHRDVDVDTEGGANSFFLMTDERITVHRQSGQDDKSAGDKPLPENTPKSKEVPRFDPALMRRIAAGYERIKESKDPRLYHKEMEALFDLDREQTDTHAEIGSEDKCGS
jgi:hypothetical protein